VPRVSFCCPEGPSVSRAGLWRGLHVDLEEIVGRDMAAVPRTKIDGENHRVTRQRFVASQVCVVSFLRDCDYGDTDTLPFIEPLGAALGQAGRRVLIVTEGALNASFAFGRRGRQRLRSDSITRIGRNVDLLLVLRDLDEFESVKLLRQHRDSGDYTHVLVDSGGEDSINIMYQVGVAVSDLTIVCLSYSRLPAHPRDQGVLEWVAAQAPQIPRPPAEANRQRWVHAQADRLQRLMGTIAGQGRALFGSDVWEATYEQALGSLAFDAWVAANDQDAYEYPLWVNAGRPLRDEAGSIAYLDQVAASVWEVLGDRDYLGLPQSRHRTAILGYDVEGETRWWNPLARRLSAGSPVAVLHTAIPYAPDEPTPFPETPAGRAAYRQAAINLDQMTGHRKQSRR
jgi:hypothetical protein